ncbi:hypothetical protein AM501_00545 [Aneurinibacillus migulanus]|uniref:LysM peptidoglycan-binding domain-containing protein n=1 Tax=Aneurinibacillus migulanus TaxID=47500 RepID=UPI0006B4193B|nr:LysM domain-containing protein [Aneurinibacillus migulanus]KPD10110.1 hypothetical protein AM501_00545 [Aneurinibacillus migulanus]
MKKLYLATLSGLLSLACIGVGTAHAASYSSYKVKSGDTAYKISQRYSISFAKLKESNPEIEDLNRLYSEQNIKYSESGCHYCFGKNLYGDTVRFWS